MLFLLEAQQLPLDRMKFQAEVQALLLANSTARKNGDEHPPSK
jgi:hypothetical protein